MEGTPIVSSLLFLCVHVNVLCLPDSIIVTRRKKIAQASSTGVINTAVVKNHLANLVTNVAKHILCLIVSNLFTSVAKKTLCFWSFIQSVRLNRIGQQQQQRGEQQQQTNTTGQERSHFIKNFSLSLRAFYSDENTNVASRNL